MNDDRTETINMTVGGTREVNFEVVGGSGTSNYERLANKPSINDIELVGNKTSADLGLQPAGEYLTEETDPIFSASPSANITTEDITNWNNKSEFSGNYNDLTNKPDLSGYITKDANNLTYYTKSSQLSNVATSGSYNDLNNKPSIPSNTSDLNNNSGFITKEVNNLTYYTLKTNTGSLIDLEINGTTYIVTIKLKDIDGNVISTDTIDLPLENVVVGGSYDNETKKVILTLENGNTVEFSVADLVVGLQTEITSSNKLASDLVDDTNSGNKFTTTSEKNIWNNKYDKPTGGIPKNDLSSAVQTSLDKANTALQTETDPVFTASASYGISSSDITNWNNKSDFSGSYNDLSNKPTIPDELADLSDDSTHRLVTDTEKTTWNSKQNALTAGNNITISSGTISATDTTYNQGENISIQASAELKGDLEQDGTPTPSDPVDVDVVTGNNTITLSNGDNTKTESYAINLGTTELCKIGTYQDKIYKSNNKWYVHKETGKLVMSDITGWSKSADGKFYKESFVSNYGIARNTLYSNIFSYETTAWNGNYKIGITSSNNLWITTGDSTLTNYANVPSWLSNKNAIMYGVLSTPTNTEITNATLITQLNALAEGLSNKWVENITQINANLEFEITYDNEELTISSYQDMSGKLDASKVKTTTSTTSGDVYDVTYINTQIGNIETLLSQI